MMSLDVAKRIQRAAEYHGQSFHKPECPCYLPAGLEKGSESECGRDCQHCTCEAPAEPGKFGNTGTTVFRSGVHATGGAFNESIATARSTSMAKRIAAALNWYKPGPRGT